MRAPPDTPIGAAGLHNTTDRSPASRAPNFFSIFFPSAPNARDRATKIAHHKIGCRRSKTAPRESAMHGRVRFSIGMAVVTTTDREFRVNLPHRRLLCAVRGAAKTPQNAEAKPSTAVGRPTEPTGPMPAERDGPCTCEVGVWVSRRNGRAGRRAERERDKGNRDRDRRCRADAPTAARRCLAASAPRLLCCGDQITSFRGGSKAHAFTAKAKNVSAMSGEVTAKLSTCRAGKPTDFCFELRVPPAEDGCCTQASTRDGARPRSILDQDLPRSSAATATGHTARHVDGRDI